MSGNLETILGIFLYSIEWLLTFDAFPWCWTHISTISYYFDYFTLQVCTTRSLQACLEEPHGKSPRSACSALERQNMSELSFTLNILKPSVWGMKNGEENHAEPWPSWPSWRAIMENHWEALTNWFWFQGGHAFGCHAPGGLAAGMRPGLPGGVHVVIRNGSCWHFFAME